MRLKRALRTGVAAICIGVSAAPAGIAAPLAAVAPSAGVEVRVARAKTFSRVEFRGARSTVTREGDKVVLNFARDADPDLSRLRTSPPPWFKTAEARRVGGRLQVVLTLVEGAEANFGVADGATYVNAFEKPASESEPVRPAETTAVADVVPTQEPETVRANPVPADGVVHMNANLAGGRVTLSFPWAASNGAAVFRRGDVVWMVFDAPATIDVSRAPRGLSQFATVQAFRGEDYSAIRIASKAATPVFADNRGSVWTLTLGGGTQGQSNEVRVGRDEMGGPAALRAPVSGVTKIVRFSDPVVGDVLPVVTALAPAKGLPARREFVHMALLASPQGLAVEPYVDDLEVTHEGDIVRIGRPAGLALSPAWAAQGVKKAAVDMGAPRPAAMPALIDEVNWPRTGEGGFLARYNQLLAVATDEAGKGRDAPAEARMALARFLVGSELSFEAIGMLNDIARAKPSMLEQPEFRGLRGAARVMARRYKEAQADFSAPAVSDDPSSALWRSYIATQLAQWPEARQQFAAGAEAFNQFSPVWRARFARADAQAALALGDLAGANERIKLALADKTNSAEELATRLVQAKIIEAGGNKARALGIYQAITQTPLESLSSPALLRATQIRLELGSMTPADAARVFDGLRYRWRGDATEIEAIRALGMLYLQQGRYREALEVLRSAGKRQADLPETVQLQAYLGTAFRALFLDGLADGLEPIQALALFYDFKELTPIGADGDLMVRKLVRRLVDVDLLNQASDLLTYQVDNRLEGPARAQVATDLAVIHLMDREPEKALQAINASRSTVLPPALNTERRLIEARAWTALGRFDSALEIIGRDNSPDAQDLRAEVTWKQKDWASAGATFEHVLGERWKAGGTLTTEEEGRLLRAGVAYSLAGDAAALERMYGRYQGFFEQSRNPDALRVALSGMSDGRLTVADFGRATADNEAFAGWVAKMKKRFREPPAVAAKPAAAVKQAAASGSAKG